MAAKDLSPKTRSEPMSDTTSLLIITVAIFLVMYLTAAYLFSDKGFAKPQMFFNLLNENAALIIISCGLSIVMIAGGIDISVGGLTALITVACVVHLNDMEGSSFLTSLLLALGIGLAFGLVQGFLVAYLDIQPFIVTLAGMFFARGQAAMIDTQTRTVANESFSALAQMRIRLPIGSVNNNGVFVQAYMELGVVIALLVVAALFVTLRYTTFGRSLYAVGGNKQSALMLGLNVKRTKFLSHVLCGLLTGLGGFVFLLHVRSGAVTHAAGYEMDAIAASIIGGTMLTGGVGNIFGTFIGVLTKGAIGNIVRAMGLVGSWWPGITLAAMLCFFLILQSVITSRKRAKIG
ncbi:MAG: sugar ABC transporter permease YjfF [Deltaproteobacteria bacterium]|jgi:simple sugar transport system permease protein|nr:sugar ABC transporter permease YjfF [Deltaproteobacteria bacterium]